MTAITAPDLETVIAALDRLQNQVDQQRQAFQRQFAHQEQRIQELQRQVAAIRANGSRAGGSRLRSFAPLLVLLGLIVWSATLVGSIQARTPASPQTTGQPLLIGSNNSATARADTTKLINPSRTEVMPKTLLVDNYSTASLVDQVLGANTRVAIVGSTSGGGTDLFGSRFGVVGLVDAGTGVHGKATAANSVGVSGLAQAAGGVGVAGVGTYGGLFSGSAAPIRLNPSASAGPPTSGAHETGELYVSADGHLYFCQASGTPGTWIQLDIARTSAFVPLVQR